MAEPTSWVLSPDAVRRCIGHLRARRIHSYFPAYLHLRQRAGDRTSGIRADWRDLGRYLAVDGASSKYPYFRPFWHEARETGQDWLNENLAGSYAGSSLRVGNPPLLVVDYNSSSRTFTLRERHWELAREHLLFGERIPVVALAGFFLRDFAFEADGPPPTDDELQALFATQFGYTGANAASELEHLYDDSVGVEADWFEAFEPPSDEERG